MKRTLATLITAAVVVAACGSDDGTSLPGDSVPVAPVTEVSVADPPADDAVAATDPAVADGNDGEVGEAFPVTIDHKFGSTTIAAEPERVVSIGFNEHDFLLALGVVPVGLREWYGDQPNGVWPWAQAELGGATPEVLAPDALNFEQIAALDPDVIVGVWSGMSAEDYELLAAIAPTVAQPDTYDDYGTPWQEQTEILGRATGRSIEAAAIVDDLDARFAAVRDEYPQWRDQEASVAFVIDTNPGAYTSQDTRSRIMADLGFAIPEVNDSGGDGSFYLDLTPEDIDALDVDVLVWTYSSEPELEVIVDGLPTRPSLGVVQQGGEVFAGPALTGAFSHASPLSLDFALDALIPEIAAAADGDPATPVPSAAAAGVAAGAGASADTVAEPDADDDVSAGDRDGDGESAAAIEAWATVFDSSVDFATKAPYLADADALESAVQAYTDAGAGFGGISLVPTDVAVDGDVAEITYDVNFGENPAYSDQTGVATLVDGVWTVSRDEFCAFMSSARVSCS